MTRAALPWKTPAQPADKDRRLASLSRIYFSGPEAEESLPDLPGRTGFATLLAPIWNAAGALGEQFVESVGDCLEKRGWGVARVHARGTVFRLPDGCELADGRSLLEHLDSRRDAAFAFLCFGGGDPDRAAELMRCGDTGFLLVDGELPSLVDAYRFVKRLSSIQGGPGPVVLSLGSPEDPWSRIAPLRLAEAATRFLSWRISIWYSAGPEAVAGRLEEQSARVERRRERGAESLTRRLAPLLRAEGPRT